MDKKILNNYFSKKGGIPKKQIPFLDPLPINIAVPSELFPHLFLGKCDR